MTKPNIQLLAMPLIIALLLTACEQPAPSNSDVLNAYKDWAVSRQKDERLAAPLPDTAVVDGCKRTPDPFTESILFACDIKFGGKDDPNKHTFRLGHGFHGWSIID